MYVSIFVCGFLCVCEHAFTKDVNSMSNNDWNNFGRLELCKLE